MELFRKKKMEQKKPMHINLVDVVKQASVQIKYEEIGSWLATHKTPLFWCHDKGFSIVDKTFIDDRAWLKRALNRMVKEIEEKKKEKREQASQLLQQSIEDHSDKAGYIG